MKNKLQSRNLSESMSRRKFLGQSTAAAIGFSIVPRRVLGGLGYVPPSDKVNIAFVGVGAQGLRVMLHFLREPDVQGVAVCDCNKTGSDYPQWDTHEFCKSVRKLLGVDSGWDWLSPDQPIQLTHSLQVTGGVAGREPCQKIVEGYYGTQQRSGQYHGCAAYSDFRELLEKQKDLDAVVVCTTDNLHAAVSAAAMKKGKHVFCQKPLTHTIYEARRIAEIAKQTGVATQIAVANQASESHAPAMRMDLGWSNRSCARGPKLVQPSLLGARNRTPEELRTSARWLRLGSLAGACAATSFQPRLSAVRLAWMDRFRLWRVGRYGFLQLRHNFPSPETRSAYECRSKFHRPL